MNSIKEFFSTLFASLRLLGFFGTIKAFCLGVKHVSAFRTLHGRDPNEDEWTTMAREIDQELH